jgi:hypothetical protein
MMPSWEFIWDLRADGTIITLLFITQEIFGADNYNQKISREVWKHLIIECSL